MGWKSMQRVLAIALSAWLFSYVCMSNALAQPSSTLPASDVSVPYDKAVVISVLEAGQAASAKAVADIETTPGTPANLIAFYAHLKSQGLVSSSSFIPRISDLPPNLKDPSYLVSLGNALGSRPFIWLPEKELKKDEFPETVALIDSSVTPGGQTIIHDACSGTVIGQKAILSAAHCVCDFTHTVSVRVNTTNWLADPGIQLAVSGRKSMLADCSAYRKATIEQRRELLRSSGDVAIFIVNEDIRRYGITPARVTDGFKSHTSYYITGYGISDDDKAGPRRRATIQGMKCDQAHASSYGCNPEFEFWGDGGKISGRPDKPDACKGDSGGPVYESNASTPATVIGVISRPVNGTSCGQGGIYVALTGPVLHWVNNTMAALAASASSVTNLASGL